jgi:L-threonylcarbamoyladenylate synthase
MADPNPSIRPYGTAAIADGTALIRGGGIVAVPTETVYGLAADATNAAAEELAVFDADARALAAAFWPGPLTLVLPVKAGAEVASLVTAGLDTVAIRVPAGRAMRALIEATSKPLAAPSANASNRISPTRAEHVATSLGGQVPLIIDDGACSAGVESTIVHGRTILRPGPITAEMIADVLPAAISDAADAGSRPVSGSITAPGQLASHYAPSKPLRLGVAAAEADEYLIGFDEVTGDATLSPSGNLIEAAARLFDALHTADADTKPRIAVAPIPEHGIGAAINDRLRRAAH